uniref:Uncharacterized protein n=1 Tax=Leersia perrieri TaxID=77586 RepID=A0A0D9XVD7_9ORYZ
MNYPVGPSTIVRNTELEQLEVQRLKDQIEYLKNEVARLNREYMHDLRRVDANHAFLPECSGLINPTVVFTGEEAAGTNKRM